MSSIDTYRNTNLSNFPNNIYNYLKDNNDKRIKISEDFDYDYYKEILRIELSIFSFNFNSLVNLNSKESKDFIIEKAKLKNYVDEILDNEYMLDNYTIYKIQQFINKVAKDLIKNEYKTFNTISKNEKYLKYHGIEIDMSDTIGFITANKVISHLYKEFNLKRMSKDEIMESISNIDKNNPCYSDEVNKILFKSGTNIDRDNNLLNMYPLLNDDSIKRYIEEGYVAEKTPKKVLKKVIKNDVEEFPYSEVERQ